MINLPDQEPQKTDYWCGNTALLYALKEQHLVNGISQEILAEECETTEDMGTDGEVMKIVAKRHGAEATIVEGEDGHIALLLASQLRDEGASIIFDYLVGDNLEEDGHYIVFQGLNETSIDVLDPSDGQQKKLDIDNFVSRWVDLTRHGKIVKSWMLIIKAKDD